MASSSRSDMKMPAMATAQSAREILRRVLGGRTTTDVCELCGCIEINIHATYQHMISRLSVSLRPPRIAASVGFRGGPCEVGNKAEETEMD